MAGLCEGGNEPAGSLKASYLASELDEGDNAGEMSPGSSTYSYPAFAHIGLRENPGKNLNKVTCPDRDSNPGHLVSRSDALSVAPQLFLFGVPVTHQGFRHFQPLATRVAASLDDCPDNRSPRIHVRWERAFVQQSLVTGASC
ncbi:hypothetical protein ANN_27380 [Periplaneta americana]|uniref:Uncharacterized protein n=1 Tax=Periplaneta americana TaxID=6978 RepID=A0ABQ8RVL0_PERAM|nr:hypothetical protein ANN_27380 [Periplaneta americana]